MLNCTKSKEKNHSMLQLLRISAKYFVIRFFFHKRLILLFYVFRGFWLVPFLVFGCADDAVFFFFF